MKNIDVKGFFKNNSSTILTVVGAIGVGVTAVMAARDTVKAMKRIEEEKALTKKKKFKVAAPCYIPTVLCGVSTILCICGANKINKNVQKSLTSAYILLDKSFKEYREAVDEVHGEDADTKVVEKLAEDKVEEVSTNKKSNSDIFFDFYSLQFFESTVYTIVEAERRANELLNTRGYVSLGELYYLMGEDKMVEDRFVGWSVGAGKAYLYDHVELVMDKRIKEDGSEYYIIDFSTQPTEDYMLLL